MLTIHLDLIKHKLLSMLGIYKKNVWIEYSVETQLVFWSMQYRTRPVVYRTRPVYTEQTLTIPGHTGHVR